MQEWSCPLKQRRTAKKVTPVVEDKPEVQPAKPGDKGPWFRVVAEALHSRTYRGLIDLGTYTAEENKKGRVQKRIEQLQSEGYQNVSVREIKELA